MIKQLKIYNFKCFEHIIFDLSSLTLFTGFNAAGKSTTLQSLLLLSQHLRSNSSSPHIALNGPLTQLGNPGDVINSGDGDTAFELQNDECSIKWRLTASDRLEGTSLKVDEVTSFDGNKIQEYQKIKKLNSLYPVKSIPKKIGEIIDSLNKLIFLSAIRTTETESYPIPYSPNPVHADVGLIGEFAPWLFHKHMDDIVSDNKLNDTESAPVFRRQLNAWANALFPGAEANVLRINNTNLMRLELRIGATSEWCRPANIGYGLTYAFPILVAGLLAKPGQILIIDSPEAHLHPMGQSKMGEFLAKISAAGVQVLIETHSDHLLNGVRKAILDGKIQPLDTAIHFFGGKTTENSNNIVSPTIDNDGNLSDWPEGFFDQIENDMAYLSGWGA